MDSDHSESEFYYYHLLAQKIVLFMENLAVITAIYHSVSFGNHLLGLRKK